VRSDQLLGRLITSERLPMAVAIDCLTTRGRSRGKRDPRRPQGTLRDPKRPRETLRDPERHQGTLRDPERPQGTSSTVPRDKGHRLLRASSQTRVKS
jgi:hypothetical protein